MHQESNTTAHRGNSQNRQQRRAAIARVRSAGRRPGVNPDRVASEMMRATKGGLLEFTAEMIRHHGLPPFTKDVAAAHEAGHATLGIALGGEFVTSAVFSKDGRWEGYTDVRIPAAHDGPSPFNILRNPNRGRALAMHTVAGLIGEHIAGLHHPASSTEEALKTLIIADGLAKVNGTDRNTEFSAIAFAVEDLIRQHMPLFVAISGHLRQRDRVMPDDIQALIDRSAPKN